MWLVRLKGDEATLDTLRDVYSEGDLTVKKLENQYWLYSASLDRNTDSKIVYNRGEELIEYLNAALKLYSNQFARVQSDGYCVSEDGKPADEKFKSIVSASIPILINSIRYPAPARESYKLYSDNPRIKYVLKLFNQAGPDWYSLFAIHETIETDEQLSRKYGGGLKAIKSWSKTGDTKRFLGTANWHRHSDYWKSKQIKSTLPAKPMKLHEAEEYVRGIIIAWLSFKAGQHAC